MELDRTKLICTIGPASGNREMLKELMLSGMNAARLNFSHGTHAEHKDKIEMIKEIREELGLPIAIILDTRGPEIRTGRFEGGSAILAEGQKFTIMTKEVMGNSQMCSASYKALVKDVAAGDTILIDDGLIELGVEEVSGGDVVCVVHNGGEIKDHKSINIPGVSVHLPAMSLVDKDDIEFGINAGVDFIAASFIRKASDVDEIRKYIHALGAKKIKIIAKIENKEGIDNIDEIVRTANVVMVARGDLGVEIPPEEVPLIQKEIIRKCNKAGIPVITATQMMDSMIRNPRPTRAEVADVANAVLDGTDAIMLSGETASGKYPLEAVKMMRSVARSAEVAIRHGRTAESRRAGQEASVTSTIGFCTCSSADTLGAKAIVTPTSSGQTAVRISKYRPKAPIIAFSMDETAVRQLALVWGVTAFHMDRFDDQQEFFRAVIRQCMEHSLVDDGDLIVLTAGIPLGTSGNTNMMRIHEIGNEF
ncbi:MAG: pyruvate kinase [Clostridiales Family XIII bacterium]|jgi:pyruvate kinase|nr:pyruvate kinase [Clostridiales Family XIII bacterium]